MDEVFYREIVDVESWDGAASNYSSAIAFAEAH